MIFILPRVFRRHIQGQTWKLHHLVHATWRPSCVRFDFKLYKMRTESKNHENGRKTLTSHVEAMKIVWKCLKQDVMQDGWNLEISMCDISLSHVETSEFQPCCVITCSKHSQFFSIDSTYHVKVSRSSSWFSDSVCILYNFKSNLTQLGRHVSCTIWSSFHVYP
jgi:hypothetical protein